MPPKGVQTTKKKPEYCAEDVIQFFLAYNAGVANIPASAQSRDGFVRYTRNKLFRDEKLAAEQVTRKGTVLLFLRPQAYQTTCRTRGSGISYMISRYMLPGNGVVIENFKGGVNVKTLTQYVKCYHQISTALWLARLYDISPLSILPKATPSKPHWPARKPKKSPRLMERWEEGQKRIKAAADRMSYYTPLQRKLRAERQMLADAHTAALQVVERHPQRYGRHATIDEIFQYFDYKPKCGDMFKLLHDPLPGMPENFRSNHGPWPKLGEWSATVANPVACSQGWHLSDLKHLTNWTSWGDNIFVAEGDGDVDAADDKIAFERARLVHFVGKAKWGDSSFHSLVVDKVASGDGTYKKLVEAHVAASKTLVEWDKAHPEYIQDTRRGY